MFYQPIKNKNKNNEDVINNVNLYNTIQKKLYNENFINTNLKNSSNKQIRYINVLSNKMNTFNKWNNKVIKYDNKSINTKNKYISKIQSFSNIVYIIITNNLETVNPLHDNKLISLIIGQKPFLIKYKDEIYETTKCYFNSELENIKLETDNPVMYIQLLRSYGNYIYKNSIHEKLDKKEKSLYI